MNKSRRLEAREASFVGSGRRSSGRDLYAAPPGGCFLLLPTAVTGVMPR